MILKSLDKRDGEREKFEKQSQTQSLPPLKLLYQFQTLFSRD